MRVVFFGTPDYVLPIITALRKSSKFPVEIVAVVTQAPKPAGRKKLLTYSAIDTWAHEKNSKIKNQNAKIKILHDPNQLIAQKVTAEIGIVAAYGTMIPAHVIKLFPLGLLNVHPSLLPSFRGASPVQATIMTDSQPGCTIIKLDEKMDHGPIVSQFKVEKIASETAELLRQRLFNLSAEVLVELLPVYAQGKIKPREQDHESATFTKIIAKEDGLIPFDKLRASLKGDEDNAPWSLRFIKDYETSYSPENIYRFFCAMQPWPGIWTTITTKSNSEGAHKETKRLKILDMRLERSEVTANAKIEIEKVQLEGKNPVSWEQFVRGHLAVFADKD